MTGTQASRHEAPREITLHHVGDSRVDRLRIFPNVQIDTYAITDCDEALELINFQSGPVCEEGVNGVTNEALLAIVADRLEQFQDGPMACDENAAALYHVRTAIKFLHHRTRRRLAAGVEGRGKP